MNIIWFFSEFLYALFNIFASLFELSVWFGILDWSFFAMGEVLSFGLNLAVSFPSDSRGSKARIVLLPSRITRWGFYHIAWIYPSTSCHLAYGVTLFLLNTLDACWIAVDEWSNSSRCRIVSIYLFWTWCLYTWSLPRYTHNYAQFCQLLNSNLFPHRRISLSWEKPLENTMAPGSILNISI